MRSDTNGEYGTVHFLDEPPPAFAACRAYGQGRTPSVSYSHLPLERASREGGGPVPAAKIAVLMASLSKSDLRAQARERRAALARLDFALAIAPYAEDLALAPGTVVGGYHAHHDEADPALLLARLVELGCAIAFPRVTAKNQKLEFHHVPDGEVLAPGSFGIPEPLAHWPRAVPGVLLVPMLAFDGRGHRLGYGGGFYDRTLAALNVPAIGVAYAGQEMDSIPHEAHDRTLDMVLTEQGIRQFR
jgi:5-formyltetrahydrofolate cyclo-ligase